MAAGVGGVDRSDGIRSATALLLSPPLGVRWLRIGVSTTRAQAHRRLATGIKAATAGRESGADRDTSNGGRRARCGLPLASVRPNGFGLAIFAPHAHNGRAHASSASDYPVTTTTSLRCESRQAPC